MSSLDSRPDTPTSTDHQHEAPTSSEIPAGKTRTRDRLKQRLQRIGSSSSLIATRRARSTTEVYSTKPSLSCASLSGAGFPREGPHSARSGTPQPSPLGLGAPTDSSLSISPAPCSEYPFGEYLEQQFPARKLENGAPTSAPGTATLPGELKASRPDALSRGRVASGSVQKPPFHFWNKIPHEIRVAILSCLRPTELVRISRVSRAFHKYCFDGQLWTRLDATEFYSQIPAESLTKIILATAPFIQDMNLRGCVQVEHYKRSEAIVKACRNLKIANFEGCRNLRKPTLNLLVQNNPRLVQLNLTGLIGVGNSTCKAIADNCPRLESLDVSWCSKVDSKGLRPVLEKCTRLTHLRASEVRGFDDIALATVMFETNNLKHLELSGCAELTDETLCIMMQGIDPEFDILTEIPIVPHRKLEYLDLSRCSRLTDAGVKTIAHATPRLEVLNLNRCKAVTDEAMIPIITSCPRITHLDLEELEHITNDLLSKHLASAPFAPKLQHMSLSYCENIGDTGVLPIIRTCTGLERICLDNTRISDLVLIEAGSMVAGRSTHSVTYGTPPEFTLDLAVYDCHHVTWTGIREILYRNTDRKGKEGSYTYPSQAIALKCFFGYQMTVDEHQRRVRKGNIKGAWRLEKKWAEYMQFTEEADITGAGFRRRRRRARQAEATLHNDGGAIRRARARTMGSCFVM